MISDDRLQKALTYLAETDEACGEIKSIVARSEFKAKAVKDAVFLRMEGSVAERNAEAGVSKEYHDAMEAYFDNLATYEKMKNKRATEAIVVDTWRSMNANRRAGNV